MIRWEELVGMSAAIATRDDRRLEAAFEAVSTLPVRVVDEVILQSYLFLGYPVALEALARWRERSSGPAEATEADWDGWSRRGEEVCARVYAGQYDALRANVRRLHPDVESWMVTEGYGKVLGRDGLDLLTRELCVIATLVVLGTPRQLYSHLRGALNVGATAEEVSRAVSLAGEFAEEDRRALAEETWAAVRERTRARPVEGP